MKLPNDRIINFLFNVSGNAGKSILVDYIDLCTKFNAILALQLASSERYVSALIDQFDSNKSIYGKYPAVIVFDFSPTENN